MAIVTWKVTEYNEPERRVYVDFTVNGATTQHIYDLTTVLHFDKPMGLSIFLRKVAQGLSIQADRQEFARTGPADAVIAMVGKSETLSTGTATDSALACEAFWMMPTESRQLRTPSIQLGPESLGTGGAIVLVSGEFDYTTGAMRTVKMTRGGVIARTPDVLEDSLTSLAGGKYILICGRDQSARYTYSTQLVQGSVSVTPTAAQWIVPCDGDVRVDGVAVPESGIRKLEPGRSYAVEGQCLVCHVTLAESDDVRALRSFAIDSDVRKF